MFYLYLDIPYPYSRSLCVIFLCLVTQTCSTLCASMDYSPPGSSVCGDSPGKTTGVCCHALLLGIFLTQGWNPDIPHCRWILYQLSHQGSEVKWTPLSCVWFFVTLWAIQSMEFSRPDYWARAIFNLVKLTLSQIPFFFVELIGYLIYISVATFYIFFWLMLMNFGLIWWYIDE